MIRITRVVRQSIKIRGWIDSLRFSSPTAELQGFGCMLMFRVCNLSGLAATEMDLTRLGEFRSAITSVHFWQGISVPKMPVINVGSVHCGINKAAGCHIYRASRFVSGVISDNHKILLAAIIIPYLKAS
jgi:hypothetical protein